MDWNAIERAQKPRNYWDNAENVKTFMDQVKDTFRIDSEEDWYRLSLLQLKELGASGLLKKYDHSLYTILKVAYPEKHWNARKSSRRDKRSVQRWLFLKTEELFPDMEIIEDFFHEELTRLSGNPVQFDLFIPQINIALEYHGIQHYKELPSFGSIELYNERDLEKEKLCESHNLPLIIIPYSWDLTKSHLHQIITKSHPNLLSP